jgi:acetyl-CoA carboxylase alpha subunit
MMPPQRLAFEQEIYELEDLLAKLEASGQPEAGEEIRRIRREIVNLKRKKYSNLSAWETVQFHELVENEVDVVCRLRSIAVAGDLHGLPSG